MSERKTFPENMLDDTLKRVAEELDEDINIYLIGGGAMIFYGRKAATKDIDIVFLQDKELSFAELQEIVHERTGYSPSWTRTKLRELAEEGFIASRLDGRRKKYRIKQAS